MSQMRMTFALLILVAFCFSVNFINVFGEPTEKLQDLELFENLRNRTTSFSFMLSAVDKLGDMIVESIMNSLKCSEEAGCHKGYCWAWCGVSLSGGEWCYTTKTKSQSYEYVECKQDSDCDPCWKCLEHAHFK